MHNVNKKKKTKHSGFIFRFPIDATAVAIV